MARKTTGIDIGARGAKLLRGEFKGGTFHVSDFALEANEGGDVARGWQELELEFKPLAARIGLTGRDVNLRYTRVPRVPDWQLRKLMRFEVDEIGDQSGSEVASDFNLLPEMPEVEGEDIVLLAMARESLLETHMEGLDEVGGTLDAFAPNSLALYNAWLRYGAIEGDTVLLANVGHDNLDVIICRGPDLVFARNLSGGASLFDQAIAERFGVSARKAEEVKKQYATLDPRASHQNANQEKASRAISGAAGQLASLLQSTLAFCKSQLKLPGLKLDRVLLCGGGARLAGLPAWLQSTMGVPVELFDPFRVVETEGLDPEASELLEKHRLECVVALGLATMASDPEAYSVEILPASVRRKREFWGGTAWLVAAAVLAVLFLGWDAWKTSQDLAATEKVASTLTRQLRDAERTDRETRELSDENAALYDRALELQAVLGAGEQLARTLQVLERKLPDELWISYLSSEWSFDPELRVGRELPRPILSMKGRARQGTRSLAAIFETFLNDLGEGLDGAELKAAPSPDGSSFTVDLTLLAPPAPGEDAEADEAEGS
jgi:Tfp pilus assembly PilM family ATPase